MFRGRIFIFVTILALISILNFIIADKFNSLLPFWEFTVLIIRKHNLAAETSLGLFLSTVFFIYQNAYSIILFLDRLLPFFPSIIKSAWWLNSSIYIFLSLPLLTLSSALLVLIKSSKMRIFFLILLIYWMIPIPYLVTKLSDNIVIRLGINYYTPFSSKISWMWSQDENPNIPYTKFIYQWVQKNTSSDALINVSCLGHYQLIINGQNIYHGPSFAIQPKVYFDIIKLQDQIRIGGNRIEVICNFVNTPVHEYQTYPKPGVLLGGYISDGIIKRDLSDPRFWLSTHLGNYQNNKRISQDTGFSENIDLTSSTNQGKISKKIYLPYRPDPRPLPLLTYTEVIPIKTKEDIYDLGQFRVGFIKTESNMKDQCKATITFGNEWDNLKIRPSFDQVDVVKYPAGNYTWNQFSRRAGRYIELNQEKCEGEIKIYFYSVTMPINSLPNPQLNNPLDQKIFELSTNTLRNNVQDHFEDSVDRERAMYLGDTLSISKCLLTNPQNSFLVKEMVNQFAESQNEDGSILAMTPSGKKMLIPDYSLQWAILFDLYLTQTKDIETAKALYPNLEKLMRWAKNHTKDRFIYNKEHKQDFDWWLFIDWTPLDNSYQYSTSLQIWYLSALRSAAHIAALTGQDSNQFNSDAKELYSSLIIYSFDKKRGVFVDSFDLAQQSAGASLITNSLAGLSELFPLSNNISAIRFFQEDLKTNSPFSQTWIIEWLIKEKEYNLARETIRNYWGGMVKEGATSIYETYNPTIPGTTGSRSHAWGCGPVYLYNQIPADTL